MAREEVPRAFRAHVASFFETLSRQEYYDACQTASALLVRCANAKKLKELACLARVFGEAFFECDQYLLEIELGAKLLEALKNSATEPNVEFVETLFLLVRCKDFCREQSRLIEAILRWIESRRSQFSTREDTINSLLQKAHSLAAKVYEDAGVFGFSFGHYLCLSEDSTASQAEAIASLIAKWRSEGYPSESHLFFLRAIMLLLTKGHIQTARAVLNSSRRHLQLDLHLPQASTLTLTVKP